MTAHCWQVLPREDHRSTAVPSANPQFTASRTFPLLTLVMVYLPLPTLANFHCWQVLPSDAHRSIAVPLAVPQFTASRTFPLWTLVSRYAVPVTGKLLLLL